MSILVTIMQMLPWLMLGCIVSNLHFRIKRLEKCLLGLDEWDIKSLSELNLKIELLLIAVKKMQVEQS